MNKTISITLGGMIYHIEEDGYNMLQEYLEAIRKYFLEHDNSDEVMDDIETSIAEKFSDLLKKNKQVISTEDVEKIISVMGDVNDYKDEVFEGEFSERKTTDSQAEKNQEKREVPEVPKKVYGDADDVVIAGVCSGLAAYMGIDPVIMRVIFVASLFFGGAGILIYFILWLAMPDAKTSSQKLEMQGKPVTIKKLEKVMKEKIEPKIGNAGNAAKRAVDLPFRALAAIFRVLKKFFLMLGPVIRLLVSFVIILGTAIGIFFVSLLSAILIFNLDSELIKTGYNLEELSQIMSFNLAVVSVWVIALIPLFFILLVGLAIWSKRNIFSFILSSTLLGVWMLAIIIFTVIAIDASPKIEKMVREHVRESVVERSYEFTDFSKLEIQNTHDARIVPGESFSIRARGHEYDLDRLDLRQRGEELVIANEWESGICLFCYPQDVEFEITMPELKEINAGGSANISVKGFSGDKLIIDYGGAVKSDMEVVYENIEIELTGASKLGLLSSSSVITADISGASKLNLQGQSLTMNLDVSGASKVNAFQLYSNLVNLEASGASQLELSVQEEMTIDASGASKVFYKGNPRIFQKNTEGSRVESLGKARLDRRDFLLDIVENKSYNDNRATSSPEILN